MSDHTSLVDVLLGRAGHQPDALAYTYLDVDGAETGRLTWAELDREARSIATLLRRAGAQGERVLLLYPQGLAFVAAFYGCLYAGAVAVPATPPRNARSVPRIRAILDDARPRVVLATEAVRDTVRPWFQAHDADAAEALWLTTDAPDPALADAWTHPGSRPESLAFLQYTSGSTALPKGVMVSHANLLHNTALLAQAWDQDARSVIVSWLPLFHDMGLIGTVLEALHLGAPCHLMSPAAFLQRPFSWLEAVSRLGATLSGGPNFAYELALRRITPEQRATLDLSRWTAAFNGAEPVRADTLERFARAFAPCGLRPEAIRPGYGLAEGTLVVSAGRAGGPGPHRVVPFDAEALEESRLVAHPAEGTPRALVGCGRVAGADQRVVIAHPETREPCPADRVGEIWISGPSVAGGYWERPEETAETFQARLSTGEGPFLRSGDLGFLHDGELFVTGRAKDVIIVHGRNHYPQDLELSAERGHASIRPGCGAAFAVDADGHERLWIACELERAALNGDPEPVVAAVRAAVLADHDLEVHGVALLRTGGIPKTTSGKIQRRGCRQALLRGELPVVHLWTDACCQPLAAALLPSGDAPPDVPAEAPPTAAPEEAGTPPAEGPEVLAGEIEAWLARRIAARAGVDAAEVDPREPFARWGFDSVAAVSLSGELEEWLDRALPPTLLYDHPTPARLARFLAGAPEGADGAAHPPVPAGERAEGGPIAIVGMGCRFPGADSPAAFWRLLAGGVDAVREVPADRWDAGAADADGVRWGGFVEGMDRFDAGFFSISPREAERMDPQQRLLLETAWEALEDAGVDADRLAGSRTGVFVGISGSDYGRAQLAGPGDAYAGTGGALSIAANRVSYALDLRGPSMAVDTACSSSLVALHLACRSLRAGECDAALAAGVNALLSPAVGASLARAGLLSPGGRCRAFDADADGYVRGEGAGVVVLKPLARAVADGDRVYAVVLGTAVNQDGRSNGLSAPSRAAQEAVVRQACADAGVVPASVQYVEAHGTGTALGDAIEAQALGSVLGAERGEAAPCGIGSVKTNIGHLESAAGIASLIKLALCIRHRALPPTLHFRTPSPSIPFAALGLRVQTDAAPWAAEPGELRAGVNSFGFGGTNAHAILADAPVPAAEPASAPPADEDGAVLLPLSARTPAALARLAAAYRDLLRAEDGDAPRDLAYTASLRRAHHDHRLAVVGRTRAELADRLDDVLAGRPSPFAAAGRRVPGHGAGRARVSIPALFPAAQDRAHALAALGARYVRGDAVEWAALHPGGGRLAALPAYPWQRERFWSLPAAMAPARRHTAPAHLPGTHLWTWSGPRASLEALARGAGVERASAGALAALAVAEVFGGAPETLLDGGTVPLPEGDVEAQVVLERAGDAEIRVRVFARTPDAAAWTLLADGILPLPAHPGGPGSAADGSGGGADEVEAALARLRGAEDTMRQAAVADYVAAVLGRVLRMPAARVERDRALTGLGVDSLMGMEIRNAISRDLGIPFALSTLFSGLTVTDLSRDVHERIDDPRPSSFGGEEPAAAGDAAGPLTEGQRALWYLHQVDPASAASNVFAAMRVRGDLDEDALRRAVRALAERHPALRTAFRLHDGVPAQEPGDRAVELHRVDAAQLDEAAFAARLSHDAHAPFDLARGDVFRARLYARPDAPVLLIALHHAVTDFWSGVVLLRDLAALYAAERAGATAALPPVEATLADAARAEAALLAGEQGHRLAEHWRARLAGLPALELPADRPRAAAPTGEGACHAFRLCAETTAAVRGLAARLGTTPYVVLLAAYQAWLARWSGQDDLAVASPVAGRTRAAWENTAGLFMNPVLLRAELAGAPAFAAHVERTARTVAEALEHAAYPLARAAELVGTGRAPGEPPFQAMFVFNRPHRLQDAGLAGIMVGQAGARFAHGGLELEALPLEERTAVCDVCLWMGESEGELHARLQYAADRFHPSTAARMAESLALLLEGALAAPETRVDALPLLAPEGRARMLGAWSAGGGMDDEDSDGAEPFVPVTEWFERRAAEDPDATAVAWGAERVGYGALNRRANQLAHRLRALGVGPDAVVGLCLDRSVELIVGMLGILKAGGAYLPLDPEHPADRRAWMLRDAGAAVVVTRRRFAEALEDDALAVVALDTERAALSALPAEDPARRVDGESLAYVIYTSGSTGTPKGTLIRHASLSTHTRSAARAYGVSPADRVLQFASATFDASVEEIFPALARGAALVLRPDRVLGAVPELLSFCAREGITLLDLPTAYWHQLAAALDDDGTALTECVRLVIIGGERALPGRVAAWNARVPSSVLLVNTYGPTECTVVATRHPVAADADGRAEVPLGRPIRGTRAYVLDRRMEPVPPGVVGELYLGGAGLARGYLGRPALTAERFVPDPFAPAPGARLYATGDRARHLRDGALEFAGRADGQVKVRGYRVEPGEVEGALAQHPDVRLAAVLAREDVPGQRRLVAYVEARRDPAPSPREVREFLREFLPDYMVPAVFVFLAALPLTPGGKVNRRALPAPDAGDVPAAAWRAPDTRAERVLAEAWQAVLGRARVGAGDNFFELGGDSILAVQALSRAARAGVRVSPRDLFLHPTLADLAAAAAVNADPDGAAAGPSVPAPSSPAACLIES